MHLRTHAGAHDGFVAAVCLQLESQFGLPQPGATLLWLLCTLLMSCLISPPCSTTVAHTWASIPPASSALWASCGHRHNEHNERLGPRHGSLYAILALKGYLISEHVTCFHSLAATAAAQVRQSHATQPSNAKEHPLTRDHSCMPACPVRILLGAQLHALPPPLDHAM